MGKRKKEAGKGFGHQVLWTGGPQPAGCLFPIAGVAT